MWKEKLTENPISNQVKVNQVYYLNILKMTRIFFYSSHFMMKSN